jgi:hypothetical protein
MIPELPLLCLKWSRSKQRLNGCEYRQVTYKPTARHLGRMVHIPAINGSWFARGEACYVMLPTDDPRAVMFPGMFPAFEKHKARILGLSGSGKVWVLVDYPHRDEYGGVFNHAWEPRLVYAREIESLDAGVNAPPHLPLDWSKRSIAMSFDMALLVS